jgi:hypothetical protein
VTWSLDPDKIRGWFHRKSKRRIRHGETKTEDEADGVTGEKRACGYRRGRSIEGSKHGKHAVGEMTVLIRSNRGHAAGNPLHYAPQRSAAPQNWAIIIQRIT